MGLIQALEFTLLLAHLRVELIAQDREEPRPQRRLAGCGKTRAASFACGLFMIPCLGFPAGVSHARIG
jgi:hypothetical protein